VLDDGKKKTKDEQQEREKQEKKPRKCPSCTALMEPGKRACPKCGFEMPIRNEVFTEEGELTKILKTEDKRDLFAQIKHVQQARGKSDGWAAWKFKNMTGVWPNHYRDVAPKPPEQWVTNKIKSLDIAFAKKTQRRNDNPMQLADRLAHSTDGWKQDALNA
jgi:DNA repair protein RadD